MVKRTKEQTYTIEEFEAKAQELLHIALVMSEERIFAAPRLNSPAGKSLAEAAMTINYALRAFIAIERLKIK